MATDSVWNRRNMNYYYNDYALLITSNAIYLENHPTNPDFRLLPPINYNVNYEGCEITYKMCNFRIWQLMVYSGERENAYNVYGCCCWWQYPFLIMSNNAGDNSVRAICRSNNCKIGELCCVFGVIAAFVIYRARVCDSAKNSTTVNDKC